MESPLGEDRGSQAGADALAQSLVVHSLSVEITPCQSAKNGPSRYRGSSEETCIPGRFAVDYSEAGHLACPRQQTIARRQRQVVSTRVTPYESCRSRFPARMPKGTVGCKGVITTALRCRRATVIHNTLVCKPALKSYSVVEQCVTREHEVLVYWLNWVCGESANVCMALIGVTPQRTHRHDDQRELQRPKGGPGASHMGYCENRLYWHAASSLEQSS